jgi:hypothetical protein
MARIFTFQPDDFNIRAEEVSKKNNPAQGGAPSYVLKDIARSGSWTGSNQVGNVEKFNPSADKRQTILKLDEWGPPEVWTVSLALFNSLEEYDGFDIKAQINFGAGGSTQQVIIDWQNGAQISLPMNAVEVIATYRNVDVAQEGPGLRLGVQLGRGRRAGRNSPIYTFEGDEGIPGGAGTIIQVLPVSNSAFIEMPPFAKRLFFAPVGNAAAVARFYSANTAIAGLQGNAVTSQNSFNYFGNTLLTPFQSVIELGAQTHYVQIQNADAANSIEFNMWAEIDG